MTNEIENWLGVEFSLDTKLAAVQANVRSLIGKDYSDFEDGDPEAARRYQDKILQEITNQLQAIRDHEAR